MNSIVFSFLFLKRKVYLSEPYQNKCGFISKLLDSQIILLIYERAMGELGIVYQLSDIPLSGISG